ncbi:TetR/AcrR family transcriptional regulator [Archangium lansingense]|uniref:TetR/AcrR family transcriptional regulator n=1 Tax=Archangium lansingense TaxID=2995310 RepID=A0ABT4AAG3_9BACT|nr:TetR/AcrR family transcriptional regulator [Archangium lansinium]MCY1078244.1 TetR/AcrR family transcriptional regulator [Archangium lansinium]
MSNEPESKKQPGLRATQKAATGQAVLEAAREEFERVGFEAANLRAIAARAGVSAGTVLHHYGDKRELLHAALFDDLEETLRSALAGIGPGSLETQLSELTRAVFGYYQRRPKLSRTLLKESLFADEPWAQKFTGQVGMVHGAIARLAEEASARGELRPGVDGALFGAAYFSFFYFALISWVQGGHGAPVAMVERLISQHLEGLRPIQKVPRRRDR